MGAADVKVDHRTTLSRLLAIYRFRPGRGGEDSNRETEEGGRRRIRRGRE